MDSTISNLFIEYSEYAIIISILLNVVIAILGVVPSVFLTGANIIVFGFWEGTLISFIGETFGAICAFYLYRKGFRRRTKQHLQRFPKVQQLVESQGMEAFFLIISLRLLPFVPSGFITFGAAVGKVAMLNFAFASLIGKAPALLLEAFSAYQVTQFNWLGKVILAMVAVLFIYWLFQKKRSQVG